MIYICVTLLCEEQQEEDVNSFVLASLVSKKEKKRTEKEKGE